MNDDKTSLNDLEGLKYDRQIKLSEIGEQGQLKLKKSSVLVVGVGGLGSPAALYLAAAGVGRIGLVDFDKVQASNLHRQVLYSEAQIGQSKVEVAKQRLRSLNSQIEVVSHQGALDEKNVKDLVKGYDIVIDGSDNFPTRYQLNDACYFAQIPLVSAAISDFEGQLTVFHARGGGCYRCVFPSPPSAENAPNCSENGVLGVLPGVMGSLQACEALKYILGIGQVLKNELLVFNALDMSFEKIKYCPHNECVLCGDHPQSEALQTPGEVCAPQGLAGEEVDVHQVSEWIKTQFDFQLIDVRGSSERMDDLIDPSDHIPLPILETQLEHIVKDKPVVVYCASGARSLAAVKALKDLGFANALNMIGGIREFRRYYQ